MENCYALLGISPAAFTEEIEEAYQRKRKEFEADVSMLRAVDAAYNEAVMATFAPIRAFASPLPPLTTGKKIPKPKPSTPPEDEQVFSGSGFKSESGGSASAGAQAPDGEALPPVSPADFSLPLQELVEKYMQDESSVPVFEDGRESGLMRFCLTAYAALVFFDMLMRFWFGGAWVVLDRVWTGDMPEVSAPRSVFFAFASVAYFFVCAFFVPLAARFVFLKRAPETKYLMWSLIFLAVISAFLLRWLTGRFLPLDVTGSLITFTIAVIVLSAGILRRREGSGN